VKGQKRPGIFFDLLLSDLPLAGTSHFIPVFSGIPASDARDLFLRDSRRI
jgi:hypothetical protein